MRVRKPSSVRIAGVNYHVRYLPAGHILLHVSAMTKGGPCDAQTFYRDVENGPCIAVAKRQSDRAELLAILHEGFHCVAPRMFSEEWIEERSEELTKLVYDVAGYRKP